MNGQVGHMLTSTEPSDVLQVQRIFGEGFRTMAQWRSFLRGALNDNASSMLQAPAGRWSVKSFQALYVACWVHHPVEKGTFMIDLSGLSPGQRSVVKAAYEKHCTGRKSSHLSGSGRSASKGWNFLEGYHELLVQWEMTAGSPFLFLKSEGHTTGLSGIIPHLHSWMHKRKTGEGLQASPALAAAAGPISAWSSVIEGRAAENYSNDYKKLLKDVLGFSGKQVTVREMMKKLFETTGYNAPPNFDTAMSNQQLGGLLRQYCERSRGNEFNLNGKITISMRGELRELAQSLDADGDAHVGRVFREIRTTPAEIDASLQAFYAIDN